VILEEEKPDFSKKDENKEDDRKRLLALERGE
jgi:hypothetical protein